MDLTISKTQMELAIKILERRAAKSEHAPTFRGIAVTTEHFDAEHLVMLCQLFADEWHKTQERYYELLNPLLPSDRLKVVIRALRASQPSFWRKIWNKIKSWA